MRCCIRLCHLESVKTSRLLGVENDTSRRFKAERSWFPDVRMQGWRYHMNNIAAAIGIAQLDRFNELSLKRQSLAKRYDSGLEALPKVKNMKSSYEDVVPHIYPIRILGLKQRNKLREKFLERGVETGIHYFPNHLLSKYCNPELKPLPRTEEVFPELITLPLHPDLSEDDVDYVIGVLKSILLGLNE